MIDWFVYASQKQCYRGGQVKRVLLHESGKHLINLCVRSGMFTRVHTTGKSVVDHVISPSYNFNLVKKNESR